MSRSETIILFLALLFAGCATAPAVGVRPDFTSRTVATVAVAPVWASSRFGLSTDEWRAIETDVETRIVRSLTRLGFDVMSPDRLRDRLERRNAWQRFEEVLDIRDGIETHFEPGLYSRDPMEVETLRSLAAEDAIGADGLLIAELVYQSTGECTADPREHNQFAVVVVGEGVPVGELPTPCVVTHFQAKLVDTRTGHTMWHNRRLREYRASTIRSRDQRANLRAAVWETLAGEHGVAPFAPSPSSAAVAGQ